MVLYDNGQDILTSAAMGVDPAGAAVALLGDFYITESPSAAALGVSSGRGYTGAFTERDETSPIHVQIVKLREAAAEGDTQGMQAAVVEMRAVDETASQQFLKREIEGDLLNGGYYDYPRESIIKTAVESDNIDVIATLMDAAGVVALPHHAAVTACLSIEDPSEQQPETLGFLMANTHAIHHQTDILTLNKAAEVGNTDVVNALLPDLDFSPSGDHQQKSAVSAYSRSLHSAVSGGDVSIAEAIVQKMADTNVALQDDIFKSFANNAAHNNRPEMLRLALGGFKSPEVKKDVASDALTLPITRGYKEIVDTLLSVSDLEVNRPSAQYFQRTPLHIAAERAGVKCADETLVGAVIVSALIAKGANVDAVDTGKNAPIHRAVAGAIDAMGSGNTQRRDAYMDAANVLLDKNADVTKKGDHKKHLYKRTKEAKLPERFTAALKGKFKEQGGSSSVLDKVFSR